MDFNSSSRRCFLRRAAAAIAATSSGLVVSRAAESRRPRILFFFRPGASEHPIIRREGGKPSLAERLITEMGRKVETDVVCEKDGRALDGDLEQYDAFVFFWNLDPLKPNQQGDPPVTERGKRRLIEAVASGKGFLGIHCASYAFLSGEKEKTQPPEQRDPYIKMLGGELCGCITNLYCRHRIVSPDFPGVNKLNTPIITVYDDLYGLKNFADDIHVIAVQETKEIKDKAFQRTPFPSIWARRHNRGRVFYVAMGDNKEVWQSEAFQNITVGGLEWILGRVDADLARNLDKVAPGARKIS